MIELKIVREGVEQPSWGSPGAAGLDLRAWIDTPNRRLTLHPSKLAALIPTGFALNMTPEERLYGMLVPRSGLGHKLGLVLGNGVGIIDNDYQGEIFISALNRSAEPIVINHGDRIAQLVFHRYETPAIAVVQAFGETSERGAGGFGSTGVN